MSKGLLYTLSATILLLIGSCTKTEVEIPSYIKIDDFKLAINEGSEGTSNHNFTDAWVYIDDQLLGAFELPTIIPIRQEGAVNIKVRPGIKNNGIAATRADYPFIEQFDTTIVLIRDSTIDVRPTWKYKDAAVFAFIEDFEGSGTIFKKSVVSDTSMFITNNPSLVFEGTGSGEIKFGSSTSLFEVQSPDITSFPLNGTPIYLEVNFRSEITWDVSVAETSKRSLTVGFFYNDQSQQNGLYNLSDDTEWKKIYFDLTNSINVQQAATNFNITFGMGNASGQVEDAKIYLDNIKLIHF